MAQNNVAFLFVGDRSLVVHVSRVYSNCLVSKIARVYFVSSIFVRAKPPFIQHMLVSMVNLYLANLNLAISSQIAKSPNLNHRQIFRIYGIIQIMDSCRTMIRSNIHFQYLFLAWSRPSDQQQVSETCWLRDTSEGMDYIQMAVLG